MPNRTEERVAVMVSLPLALASLGVTFAPATWIKEELRGPVSISLFSLAVIVMIWCFLHSWQHSLRLPRGVRLTQYTEPPDRTKFELTASKDLRGKAIRISFDGPISGIRVFAAQHAVTRKKYRILEGGSYGRQESGKLVIYSRGDTIELTENETKGSLAGRLDDGAPEDGEPVLESGEESQEEDIRVTDDPGTVIFDFGGQRFFARPFLNIAGEVSSKTPITITRVEFIKLRRHQLAR